MTQDEQGYNGWKNHATWVVNLHLSNDEPLYRRTLDVTREAIARADDNASEHPYWTVEEGHRCSVADMLREMVEELCETSLYERSSEPWLLIQDLIGGYLGDVDWDEIADAWIEMAAEQVTT